MAVRWLSKVPLHPRVTAQVEALWLRKSFVLRPVYEENQAKVPPSHQLWASWHPQGMNPHTKAGT